MVECFLMSSAGLRLIAKHPWINGLLAHGVFRHHIYQSWSYIFYFIREIKSLQLQLGPLASRIFFCYRMKISNEDDFGCGSNLHAMAGDIHVCASQI